MPSANELKSRFIQLFREYTPSDSDGLVREGSVVVDQIINPLSMVLEPVYDRVDQVAKQNNPPSQTSTGDVLEATGRRMLVERQQGTNSTAEIHIVLDSPSQIRLPKGTPVFSGETEFQFAQDITFAENQFSETTRQGRTVYESPLITVEAVPSGPEGEVAKEKINTPGFTISNADLLGVYNPQPSTNSREPEGDDRYRDRIKESISSRSMDTEKGLKFLIGDEFGDDVRDISLVGPGDPEMKRDQVYVRRSISNSELSVDVDLTRSTGTTDSISVTINGNTKSVTVNSNAANVVGYSIESSGFVHEGRTDNTDLQTQIENIAYGAHVLLFVPQNISENDLNGWSTATDRLSLVKLPSTEGASDYLSFSRKGDRNFIPKEQFSDPTSGNVTIGFSSTIYEYGVGKSSSIKTVGFTNKTAGKSTPNASRAFVRQTREIKDAPNAFDRELNQPEYNRLSRPDFDAIQIDTDKIYSEDFTRSNDIQTAIGGGWICGNTGEKWQRKDSASGCFIMNNKLVLGPREVDPSVVNLSNADPAESLPVILSQTSKEAKKSASRIDRLLRSANASSDVREQVIDEFISANSQSVDGIEGVEGNTSPIVQRKLEQPFGFRIRGTVRTTDENGNPACITMARVENPEDASQVNRGPAKFRWFEGYGLALAPSDNTDPNIFIVDNASADRQLTVVGDEYVNGKLDYNVLNQTFKPIDPYTDYEVEITAGAPEIDDNAIPLNVRVWEKGTSRPSDPTISYGAYVPENRRDDLLAPVEGSFTNAQQNPLDATHIGIGVSRTEGKYMWVFDDFEIENVSQVYAQSILELDVRGLEEYADIRMVARGQGHEDGVGITYGHDMYVWNDANTQWEADPVLEARYDNFEYWTSENRISLNQRVTQDGFLRVLVTSAYPHEGIAANPNIAKLDIDYVEGGNYNRVEHTGGKTDMFFKQQPVNNNRPTESRTHTISNADNLNQLEPSDFGGPIATITRVAIGDVALDPQEFRTFWEDDGLRGSMNETFYLGLSDTIAGNDIEVTADVHTKVPSVDNFIRQSDRRKVDADLLSRHKQIVWVDVTLDVQGNFVSSPQSIVEEYISEFTDRRLTMSDIGSILLNSGATRVDRDNNNVVFRKRWIDINGNEHTEEGDVLSINRTETFAPGTINIQTQ